AGAEKLSCGIGAHPFLAILLCCELSVGSSPVPGSDSAHQPISGASPMSRRKPAIAPTADERFAQALTNRFDSAAATHRRDPTLARDSARPAKPTARRTRRR